jgi:hypothetical protein
VVLEGRLVPRWISRQLAQLRAAPFLELVLVVIAEPVRRRARRPLGELLFSLYQSADYRMFKTSPDALELVDAKAELGADIPVLEVQLDSSPELFSSADLEVVRSHGTDVILWFADGQPVGGILDCARHGVWTVHHGHPTRYRGGPPFFWELFDRETVTATVVEVFAGRDRQPRSIYWTRSAVHPQSLYQTRNAPYWKAAQFMLRCLKRLEAEGERAFEPAVGPVASEPSGTVRARGVPTNAQMAWFTLRLLGRAGRSRLRRLFYREHWFLAYRSTKELELTDDAQACALEMEGFTIVSSRRSHSSADPFVLSRDGAHHVFFEEVAAGSERGEISQFELRPDGSTTDRKTVLSRGYHLSYPFVFAMGGETYMLPETAANDAIELYRAEEFPTRWTFDRTLIADVKAVDPTLLERNGTLWLFANVKGYGAPYSDELFVYHAHSLDGPWTPHPGNPVVSDVRRARPAGRIFEHRGVLIRPGQDSAGRYGRAVSLNRIDVLSEHEYRETEIGRIEETWRPGNLGTHTYNFDDLYEVIDGRELVFRLRR